MCETERRVQKEESLDSLALSAPKSTHGERHSSPTLVLDAFIFGARYMSSSAGAWWFALTYSLFSSADIVKVLYI